LYTAGNIYSVPLHISGAVLLMLRQHRGDAGNGLGFSRLIFNDYALRFKTNAFKTQSPLGQASECSMCTLPLQRKVRVHEELEKSGSVLSNCGARDGAIPKR
jgi:hypothetical protein